MLKPTLFTYVLIAWGFITTLPLFYAQLLMLLQPEDQKTKDLLIGKGEEWRDPTHYGAALGAAWADWLVVLPLLIAGSIGMIKGAAWAYVCYASAGAITFYINIVLWFQEKSYVYPSRGPWIYYTYYWGNFIYWGLAAVIYSILRLSNL